MSEMKGTRKLSTDSNKGEINIGYQITKKGYLFILQIYKSNLVFYFFSWVLCVSLL